MRKLFVKLKKQIMKILKIIILLLISTSVFGQIKGTQEVNNIKINGEIKTSTITPNIIPDYVITKDTTNDITTYSSVSDVTAVSIASLVDTLELYEFDSLNVVKLIIDNSYITQDADTLLAVMNGIKMLRMTEDTIYIDSTAIFGGNVGIGTTSPGYKLDVNGNIQISNNQPYLILNDTTVDESNFYLVANGDKFYIGPTSQSTTNAKLTILDTGNVGIGTISPGAKLDVSGTGRFSGALTVIAPTSDLHAATKKYVDDQIVTSFGTDNQIPFTNSGGTDFDYSHNFTWNDTTLGISQNGTNTNIFIGKQSGISTTGFYNTFLGYQTGNTNTTGFSNTYIGMGSGKLSTGKGNIFLGYNAGYNEIGSDKLYIENSNSTTPLIYGDFDNDIVKINGTQIQSTNTIADNDATPDVSAANVWTYNGTANAVTVTDLDNPDIGAIYRIIGNSDTYTITINDSGNFNLSATWVGGIDDVLTIFVQADNDYIEISRSNN